MTEVTTDKMKRHNRVLWDERKTCFRLYLNPPSHKGGTRIVKCRVHHMHEPRAPCDLCIYGKKAREVGSPRFVSLSAVLNFLFALSLFPKNLGALELDCVSHRPPDVVYHPFFHFLIWKSIDHLDSSLKMRNKVRSQFLWRTMQEQAFSS